MVGDANPALFLHLPCERTINVKEINACPQNIVSPPIFINFEIGKELTCARLIIKKRSLTLIVWSKRIAQKKDNLLKMPSTYFEIYSQTLVFEHNSFWNAV